MNCVAKEGVILVGIASWKGGLMRGEPSQIIGALVIQALGTYCIGGHKVRIERCRVYIERRADIIDLVAKNFSV
jgi:hypothetical protein